MADDTERLVLEMSADLRRFENSLDRANRAADRRFNALEKRAAKSAAAVERSFDHMGAGLRNALATLGVGLALREVQQYADAWTSSANKLATAGVAAEDIVGKQEQLADLARETRSSYESTADLYAKIARASQGMGASELQVARAVETVNKALATGGASASERNSAILQLGQALGSGALQGDELRAIRENSPALARAIAAEFNTTVGGLKKLGEEGKLTSERVFKAILKGSTEVDAQFAKTRSTIADAFTTLETEATRFIGRLDQATGSSAALAGFIKHVADNLDLLAQAAIIAGAAIGGVLVGRGIQAIVTSGSAALVTLGLTRAALQATGVAATAGAVSMNALRAAMAFLGGPWGVVITAIAVAVGVYAANATKAVPPTADLKRTTDALTVALAGYEKAALDASVATGKDAEAAKKAAAEKRALAIAARDAAKAQLEQAKATLVLLDAQARQLMANAGNPTLSNPEAPGFAFIPLEQKAKQAEANRAAAAKALADANAQIAAIDKQLAAPALKSTAPPAKTPAGSKRDLALSKDLIAAEVALEAAQLAQDVDRTRELERQQALLELARKYESAGLKRAEALAAAAKDQATLDEARATGLEKQVLEATKAHELELATLRNDYEGIRALESKIELAGRIKDYQENGFDLTTATNAALADQLAIDKARAAIRAKFLEDAKLEHEIEIARLLGDEKRLRLLEREAAIRERKKTLEADGGLAPAAAADQAAREQSDLDVATMRGKFRTAFRDGVRAAIEGDLGGFFQSMAADLADKVLGRSLDVLADALFDTLAEAFPKLFDLGSDLLGAGTTAATIGTAITAAGTEAGFTMGTAIATSASSAAPSFGLALQTGAATAAGTMAAGIIAGGAKAAALMAAAVAGGTASDAAATAAAAAFRGFRAGGGPARFTTQERGPEGFARTAPGVVFSTAAMKGLADLGRQAKQGRVASGGDLNVEIHNNGAPADAKVERGASGDVKVTLEPVFNAGLDAAGQSGRLERALRRRPRAKVRG